MTSTKPMPVPPDAETYVIRIIVGGTLTDHQAAAQQLYDVITTSLCEMLSDCLTELFVDRACKQSGAPVDNPPALSAASLRAAKALVNAFRSPPRPRPTLLHFAYELGPWLLVAAFAIWNVILLWR